MYAAVVSSWHYDCLHLPAAFWEQLLTCAQHLCIQAVPGLDIEAVGTLHYQAYASQPICLLYAAGDAISAVSTKPNIQLISSIHYMLRWLIAFENVKKYSPYNAIGIRC